MVKKPISINDEWKWKMENVKNAGRKKSSFGSYYNFCLKCMARKCSYITDVQHLKHTY